MVLLAGYAFYILNVAFIIVLLSSIFLTLKTRFVQVRLIPVMLRGLFKSLLSKQQGVSEGIQAYKALFVAMSTTIGITTIVGPVIAIRLGGPGALVFFLLAIFFGASTTFAEVTLALQYRKKQAGAMFIGGPMQYMQREFSSWVAVMYAWAGSIMLMAWSGDQSNTVAALLEAYKVPKLATGVVIATFVVFLLYRGIHDIGNVATVLLPFMFFLYCGACLWVIGCNITKIPDALRLICNSITSLWAPTGAGIGLMVRWGLTKGIQASEAGVGTQTIPHSQSETDHALNQGALSMASLYSIMILCTLSGLVTLVTGTWNNEAIPLGIYQVSVPFCNHLFAGHEVLTLCGLLFGLTTILGNAYNGSRLFLYVTHNNLLPLYYAVSGIVVVLSAICDAHFIWGIVDYFVIPVALSNIFCVVMLAIRKPELLQSQDYFTPSKVMGSHRSKLHDFGTSKR